MIGVPAKILRIQIPQLEVAFSYQIEEPAPGSHRIRAKVEDFAPSPTSQVLAINDDETKPSTLNRFGGRWSSAPLRQAAQPAYHGQPGQAESPRLCHPVSLSAGSFRLGAREPARAQRPAVDNGRCTGIGSGGRHARPDRPRGRHAVSGTSGDRAGASCAGRRGALIPADRCGVSLNRTRPIGPPLPGPVGLRCSYSARCNLGANRRGRLLGRLSQAPSDPALPLSEAG